VAPDSEDLALAGLPRERRRHRRGMTPAAWAFVASAAAFSAVAAWFLFGQGRNDSTAPAAASTDKPVEQAEPSATASATVAAGTPSADGTAVQLDGVDVQVGASGGTWPGGSPAKTASTPPTAGTSSEVVPPKPCKPDDPFCQPDVGGPTAGNGNDTGEAGGSGLSQEQANQTVSRYRGSLVRSCRPLVTKGSAKVSASIVVGPSGRVSSVQTGGGSEYPGLASCVKDRISNWTFPTSGASTVVNVSFNFL
jgi:hypothetical protein